MARYSHPLYPGGIPSAPQYAGGDSPKPGTPNQPSVIVQHRGQIQGGQRGARILFAPQTASMFTRNAGTGNLAMRSDSPPIPIPNYATGAALIVHMASNTNTTGNVTAFFYNADETNAVSGLLGGNCIASVDMFMGATNYQTRQQILVPLVNQKVTWETTTSGTVNYDCNLYFVGYVVS